MTIDFDPDEIRTEAAERVESILDTLSTQSGDIDTDSSPPVDIEETLQSYQKYRGGMVLYKRAAKAEAELNESGVYVQDVAAKYYNLLKTHFDHLTAEETINKIPELHQQVQELIEWIRQDESLGTVPDTLEAIHTELETINEIYSDLNTTVDSDAFEDIL